MERHGEILRDCMEDRKGARAGTRDGGLKMDHVANWSETEVERTPAGEEHLRGRALKHRRRAGDSPRHTTGFRDTARGQESPDIFEFPWQKSDQQMERFSANRGSPTLPLNS